jgi:hypothetical protein
MSDFSRNRYQGQLRSSPWVLTLDSVLFCTDAELRIWKDMDAQGDIGMTLNLESV